METFPSARLQPPGHTSRHRCAGTRDRKGPHTAPLTSASLPPTARALGELGCARHGVPDAAAGLLREGSESTPGTTAGASSLQRGPAARVGLRPAGGSPRKHLPRGMTHHSCLCVQRCEALARGRGAFPGQAARRACARDELGRWTVAGRLSGRGGCCPQRSWAPPGAAALPGDQGGDAGSALAEPSAHIPHRQLRGVAAGAPIPGSGLRPRRLRPRSGAGCPGPAGKVMPQSFTPHVTRPLAR